MPVYKDKNGSWYVQGYFRDYTGKRVYKKKRGFKLKSEAVAWEADFRTSFKEPPPLPPVEPDRGMLFSELVEKYLEYKRLETKPVTYRTCESRIRVHIMPYFKDYHIYDITAADVQDWRNGLRKTETVHGKPLSPGYINTLHRELNVMLNHAVSVYGLKENPASRIKNKGAKITRGEDIQFWTLDQFTAFINTFETSDPWRSAFMLLYWTGCRVGECQALTIQDVDFEKDIISINKTFHLIHGEHVVHEPKTAAGKRKVTMDPVLADILKHHISHLYEPDPGDRLFTMTPSAYGKQMKKHAAIAGLPQIRVHDLRHSHVALLIELGYSPSLIAARVGHEKPSITLDVYGHLYPTRQEEVAARLGDLPH